MNDVLKNIVKLLRYAKNNSIPECYIGTYQQILQYYKSQSNKNKYPFIWFREPVKIDPNLLTGNLQTIDLGYDDFNYKLFIFDVIDPSQTNEFIENTVISNIYKLFRNLVTNILVTPKVMDCSYANLVKHIRFGKTDSEKGYIGYSFPDCLAGYEVDLKLTYFNTPLRSC